jgi:hypothetical protein
MKKSKMDGTTVRFWNNVIFNPNQSVYKKDSKNPLLPTFFQGPKANEIFEECSDQ